MPAMTRAVAALALLFVPLEAQLVPNATQNRERPESETYHWVLPVNHSGVEVAALHPNDCYVVRQAEGVAYFGTPSPALLELQRQLRLPIAHLVRDQREHPECDLDACARVSELAVAIEREMTKLDSARLLRPVAHHPSPLDDWYGGAYTDVGSSTPASFANAPEQRMLFQHLRTTRRENCYQAKEPSTLSIHVRDQADRRDRTGVYRGFVYVEHYHPLITGDTIAD